MITYFLRIVNKRKEKRKKKKNKAFNTSHGGTNERYIYPAKLQIVITPVYWRIVL